MTAKPKKKVDHEALQSAFMKVPHINVQTARDLLDLGFKETFELIGRSPETLFDEIKLKKQDTPRERLYFLRYLIYRLENPEGLSSQLKPLAFFD